MHDQLVLRGSHPVLRDHQVMGINLLPGLAYIDVLHQIFRRRGCDFKTLELRNLSIYQPLIVAKGEACSLDILIEDAAGFWQIAIKDRNHNHGIAPTLYATAEMHRVDTCSFDEQIDWSSIVTNAAVKLELADIYAECSRHGLIHGESMLAQGAVYGAKEGVYMDCGLSAAALKQAEKTLFHPALIDASAVCGGGALAYLQQQAGATLTLPLHYESFRASALLNRPCKSRILLESVRNKADLRFFSIDFFDDAGQKIAELKGLAGKAVRDPAALRGGNRTAFRRANRKEIRAEVDGAPAARSAVAELSPMERLLRETLAGLLQISEDQIDCSTSYYEMGVDSAGLLQMVKSIESRVGASLPPTLLFEHPTIHELAMYLTERSADAQSAVSKKAELRSAPLLSHGSRLVNATGVTATTDAIAIIAVNGRYPGANDLSKLWENLSQGVDSIVEVPTDRWELEGFYEADLERAISQGKSYCKWGGFLAPGNDEERPATVAPELQQFGAETIDFLQLVGATLEQAGYKKECIQRRLHGDVGVFLGAMADGVGTTTPSGLANTVSRAFGLHGPSVAIDTMSSSSLSALHIACESLKRGECAVAIAGGIYVMTRANFITMSRHRLLGSHADSRSFSRGDGLLLSEAMGAVLLKPLAQAIADQDRIVGVIRSSAISYTGLVAGNFSAMKRMIAGNLAKANIDPKTIGYVEASANGSSVADALEVGALARVFEEHGVAQASCVIGSVKSNIGHAAAASGMSQLSKVLLQLQHRQFAPTIKVEPINLGLGLERSPFHLQRQSTAWQRSVVMLNGRNIEAPRRALINSIGGGGASASLIVEEYAP